MLKKMLEEIIENKKYRVYITLIVITGILLFIGFNLVQEAPYLLNRLGDIMCQFLDVISPVFWAFILAYLLYYPMIFIEKGIYKLRGNKAFKKKTKSRMRLISVISIFLITLLLIIGMINFIVPPLIESVNNLLSSIPEFEANITMWFNELAEYMETFNLANQEGGELVNEVSNTLQIMGESIINLITKVVGSLSSFLIDFVVTVILMFYFLKDRDKLFGAIDKFGTIVLSDRIRLACKGVIKDLDEVVGKFIIGTMLASFIVAIISTILMFIIGHPFAILIGVAAGVTNVIPYVGPILGAGLAFVLGIFESLDLAILGAVTLLIYQQIDGNIIQPKIVGDQVGLAPVWILISVLIGGSYWGGAGMILAVPVAALIAVYIERRYQKIKG